MTGRVDMLLKHEFHQAALQQQLMIDRRRISKSVAPGLDPGTMAPGLNQQIAQLFPGSPVGRIQLNCFTPELLCSSILFDGCRFTAEDVGSRT